MGTILAWLGAIGLAAGAVVLVLRRARALVIQLTDVVREHVRPLVGSIGELIQACREVRADFRQLLAGQGADAAEVPELARAEVSEREGRL